MKQPTNNIITKDTERFDSLGTAIQATFQRDTKLLKELLDDARATNNFVRAANQQGLAWAYQHVIRTSRYEENVDLLLDDAIVNLMDWMPSDKEFIEYILEFVTDDVSGIIAELILLATSIEDYHSSAEGWRNTTIVKGITERKVKLPPIPCLRPSEKRPTTLLTYVMRHNVFLLDEVERGDILPLQVYCRLSQMVLTRLCDCFAYGLVRPSWRCEKNSFRWTLSCLFEGINPQVVKAIDEGVYTMDNFVYPVRNRIIQALRDTLVRLVEFEKALNDEHIPTWYQQHSEAFYEAFVRKYNARCELNGLNPACRIDIESDFIKYVTGEDLEDEDC
jgi:hypothetical protein